MFGLTKIFDDYYHPRQIELTPYTTDSLYLKNSAHWHSIHRPTSDIRNIREIKLKVSQLSFISQMHTTSPTEQQIQNEISTIRTPDKCHACAPSISNLSLLISKMADGKSL